MDFMWMQHPLFPKTDGSVCLTGCNGQLLTRVRTVCPNKRFSQNLGDQFVSNMSAWAGLGGVSER